MCGRFAVDNEINDLIELFLATGGNVGDWKPSWNIRPTEKVPVVLESTKTGSVVRRLELARWSLVPRWSKEPTTRFPTFNARSEDVAGKASFKASVVNRRAIIPASGYYEWKTEGSTKTPYFIHAPGQQLAFAALYSWWRNPALPADDDNRWLLSATMLTMPAVPQLAGIHDRSPVPLPREFWSSWLSTEIDGDQGLVDAAVAAARPVASSLASHPVAPLRNDVNDASLVVAVDPA